MMDEKQKPVRLMEFLETNPDPPIIIFVNQKKGLSVWSSCLGADVCRMRGTCQAVGAQRLSHNHPARQQEPRAA
jgi:hypothetical protein